MRQVPSKCSACGQHNIHNLDYCAVCGKKFSMPETREKKKLSKEDKMKLKRLKKKNELTDLYKKKKITQNQYMAGLKKLGYGDQIEKAMAFKKYIREQVKAFEEMEVDPRAKEGATYYDPNESVTDLPRDENGNVIVDFTARSQKVRPTEEVPTVEYGPGEGGGPAFGKSLFGRSDSGGPKRVRADAIWDEEEEDFEIDLEEVETGWWDDEEWELEWTEEDEEEFEDWGLVDDDQGLEVEFEEDEEDTGYEISFDEDEDDFEVDFEEDDEKEDEEEEIGWDSGRRRRNR